MSNVSGPSKKRLKQSSLLEFVSRMRESRESSAEGMDSESENQTSHEKNVSATVDSNTSESPLGESALSQTERLECIETNNSQSTEVDLSQDLFPELGISSPKETSQACSQGSSQGSSHSSSSEEAAADDGCIPSSFKRTPECGVVLPALTSNHTVFCKMVPSENGALRPDPTTPYPETLVDKWDGSHVRMPCSSQSVYPVEDPANGMSLKSRWWLIERSLMSPIDNSRDLANAILRYNGRFSSSWNFRSLHKFFSEELDPSEARSFFQNLLPKIAALALQLPTLITHPIPLLKCGQNKKLSFSQMQVACLLANAFFCTFPRRNTLKSSAEYSHYPDINFVRLYSGPSDEDCKMEKLKCIINYFRRITSDEPKGMLTFHRKGLSESIEWSRSKDSLTDLHVSEKGFIEREGRGMLQVDFANKFVGGGVLGGGCVQEEIRFLVCPELLVSRLFTEALGPKEVLVITGVEQFNDTAGYADTFSWESDFLDDTPRDSWGRRCTAVVAMDALYFARPHEQYRPIAIRRELTKAFCGFSCPGVPEGKRAAVATGNWGCGAFRGDPQLKSLLQLMAAAVAGRDVVYFTFNDRRLCRNLRNMHRFLRERNLCVGDIYELLMQYHQDCASKNISTKGGLFDFLYSWQIT